MHLCQKSRKNDFRRLTCVEEHKSSDDKCLGCGWRRKKFIFPDHLKVCQVTRGLSKGDIDRNRKGGGREAWEGNISVVLFVWEEMCLFLDLFVVIHFKVDLDR